MEKIPKFHPLKILSSRNFYKKLFGIMFVSLAFLAGCRQREVLPEPANDAIDSATLAKIQAWYNPKVARLRGAKSTGTDIYLPQWGDGKLHTLPNGEKVALFPVHREKNVQYHNIGFVRRFAVRLSPTDSVKSVKLLHMIGAKEYLHQYKDEVAKNYYLNGTIAQGVRIWQQELPLSQQKISTTGTCYAEGGTVTTFGCAIVIKNACGISFGGMIEGCGLPNEGGGSGGSGGSGGGSGGGTPPDVPIYTENPVCNECFVTDPGDNTNPPQEPERKITLNSAFENNTKAMCIYERLKKMIGEGDANANNNLFWRLSLPFSGANDLRLKIELVDESKMETGDDGETDPDGIPNGFVTIRINKQIMENSSDLNTANTILHEMMHAYYFGIIHKMGGVPALLAYTGNQEPYLSLKQYYQQYEWKKAQHNVMANNTYRGFMKKALKAFMGSNQLSDWRYEGMSWAGLWMTDAWINLQESTKRTNTVAFRTSVKKDASNKSQCD